MFDGIRLNARIFGSMFDQGRTSVVRPAPSVEDTRQHMKIGRASFISGNDLLLENEPECGNRVEHSAQFFWAECSPLWPSAQHFRSIIQPNYQYVAGSKAIIAILILLFITTSRGRKI